ncbi:ribosome biogenesis protein ytm1 [Dispira simplex]|nr:ribosome biogenesis protein ytm1 [Dispira simplex]
MDKSTLTASMVEPTTSLTTSLYLKEVPILPPDEFLQSCNQLRDQVQKTKQLVCETVTTHYVDVLNTYLYVTDLRNEVVSLSDQFDRLSHSVETYGPNDLGQISTTYPDISAVIEITGREIKKLDLLSRVHAQLQEVDGLVDLGEFISAATSIAEMHRMLQAAQDINDVDWDKSVVQLLCTEFRKKRCLVQCHLDDLFGIGYGFNHKPGQFTSVVRVTATITATAARTYYDNPVILGDVLTACDILSQVRPKLEHLVNQLETVCFLPLFQHPWANLEFQSRGSTVTLSLHYPNASSGPQGGSGWSNRSTGPSAVAEVLECLKTITKLCRFIVIHLLQNEWVPSSPSPPTVTEGNRSEKEIPRGQNGEVTTEQPSPEEPEQIIEDSAVHQVFLNLWWPRFWKMLYDHLLLPIIPEDRSALASFRQELAPVLQRLEKTLKGWRLLPMDQYPLAKFIDSIHASFLRQRRSAVLATARDILKSAEMNTTEVTDATERSTFRECYQGKPHESSLGQASDQRNTSDLLGKGYPSGKGEKGGNHILHEDFRIPTYHITCQTQTLMELVYQNLQQSLSEAHRNDPATHLVGAVTTDSACDIGFNDATHDYLVARDLIQLFLALAPIRSQQGFGGEQSFVHAMLLHNDCDYLARHLVVLGKPQKEHWSYPLNQLATFVDLIPSLRNLGQTEFLGALRRRRNIVRETFLQHSAENLTKVGQDTFYKVKENDLRDALGHLTTWAKASVKFLPTLLHLQSMGLLVGDLVDTFCDWGMGLPVVTPFGTRQLLYFIQLIQGELAVSQWWETGRLGDPTFHDIALTQYVPAWPKLAQLTTYLACSEETLNKVITKLEKAQPTLAISTSTTHGGSPSADVQFSSKALHTLCRARFAVK